MKNSVSKEEIKEIERGLISRFGSTEIPLQEISEEVLNMIPRVAAQRAAKYQLPFPTHRLRNRQPWMVKLHYNKWGHPQTIIT
ncbi:pyocin activator PrtN family protein [Psychromonas sp. Urea-02u-13]|uniref:pyocin activator PrtN family protein n=1 Tax=Psychromonas sp. Urea-02u-13 TaxID=2058326 RepID=UPI000C3403AD|nr:pyocin activator PrtN family protein [Psychromonas sp. Urea-02u-13]PKG37313.1 hypothetical protein CXF74_19560 [Psychromonas sp. Urea-02u-13]